MVNSTFLTLLIQIKIVLPNNSVKMTSNCKGPGLFKDNHTYVFLASNNNFISRFTHNKVDYIEAGKVSIDVNCRFRVNILDNGNITLKPVNGTYPYLYTVPSGDQMNYVEVATGEMDPSNSVCQFIVGVEATGPPQWYGAHSISLKSAYNSKFLGIIDHKDGDDIHHNIEAHYETTRNNPSTCFIVLEAL